MTPDELAVCIAQKGKTLHFLHTLRTHDREDVCQEAFIRMLPKLHTYRCPDAVATVALRYAAINRVRELVRIREQSEAELEMRDMGEEASVVPAALISRWSADKPLFRKEQRQAISTILKPLSRHRRELVRTYADPDHGLCGCVDLDHLAKARYHACLAARKVAIRRGFQLKYLI